MMEIKYLKNLQNSPVKGKDRGVTEAEIIALESKLGKIPQVLKEFLFLAGNYCNSISANARNQGFKDYEFRHEQFEENLIDAKTTVKAPYYALTELNQEQFKFIYLNEGENPPVYDITCWDYGKYTLKKVANSLSDWIDQEIEIRLKNP